MIAFTIFIDNISDLIAAGFTAVRVYTDTDPEGAFATLDGSVSLVANKVSYRYIDVDGDTDIYYKTAYFGAVPGETVNATIIRGGTATAYVTVEELRSAIGKTREGDDIELQSSIADAMQVIDNFCNRPDGFLAPAIPTVRLFGGTGKYMQPISDCVEVTLVEVKASVADTTYEAWNTTDWVACSGDPERPNYNRTPYTMLMVTAIGTQRFFTSGKLMGIRGFQNDEDDISVLRNLPTVRVTARWGYATSTPPAIRRACLIQAVRWYKRGQASFADVTANSDGGMLLYRRTLDPDVELALSRYIMPALGRRN